MIPPNQLHALTLLAQAQPRNSEEAAAERAGQMVGTIVGLAVVLLVAYWIVKKIRDR